ncbi:MAG: hypothetical protein EKK53_21405 [Burkholderiales bacterium]|nr:MAG: hypothetical protein EKK53_21405 [Burkholderiales bacterium]
MNLKQVMKHFGLTTYSQVAELNGCTQPAVSNWVKRGRIPELAQRRFADLSKGQLKVTKTRKS